MTADNVHSNRTVRLWYASSSSCDPGPIETCCHRWLDESERERAQRFRVPTSRNQNIVGRGMARRLLCGDGVDPREIRFELLPHGKPVVVGPSESVRPFNVAHTEGLVLCGIGSTQHQLLGVDVERLGRKTDPQLAQRYFAPPEVDYLRQVRDEGVRRDVFLRIWTLKESFIKAIGTGLQTPLADFAFEEIESDAPRIRMLSPSLKNQLHWHFFCVQPRPGYVGAIAVACREPQPEVDVELRNFDELVASR